MAITLEENDLSFPCIYMDNGPYLQKNNLIENAFPKNIPLYNIEQEEEIDSFDISSSFNIFEKQNNFCSLNASSLKNEQDKEKNVIDLNDDFPKNTDFTTKYKENDSKIYLSEEAEKNLIDLDYHFLDFTSKFEENDSEIDFSEEAEEGKKEDIRGILITNKKDSELFKRLLFVAEKKPTFKVVYPKRETLFKIIEINPQEDSNKCFLRRKKKSGGRSYEDRLDNIRVKIKRSFLNHFIIEQLNEKLRRIGSNKYFQKFPQHLVSDVDKNRNKDIFGMTLEKFIENKEKNFSEKNNNFGNYYHNLDVIQDNKVKNCLEIKTTINKTIKQLYEEYINSDEFKINAISQLKYIKRKNNEYIMTYKKVAENLIEFFYH